MAGTTITKYNSVNVTLGRAMPAWVNDPDDQVRVAAYDAYDDMYANVPTTFAIAMRGTNDAPLYVPSSRRIIEATNRYLGVGWNWTITSAATNAQEAEAARAWLSGCYTINRVPAKYFSFKRGMLKRGDAVFHIFADLSAPAGQRIRIVEINPRTFFPIEDITDPERLLGVYIVNLVTVGEDAETIAMRQEYRYQLDQTGQRRVFSQLRFFEVNAWDDRWPGHPALKELPVPEEFNQPQMAAVLAGGLLPASVNKLPVYHAANNRQDEERFGTSEISGMETLIAGLNQAASDEDIALALQGLGMYVTTAPRPVDGDTGEETDWFIEPGYVLELKEGQVFQRVAGLDKLQPFQEHLDKVSQWMDESAGLSAVAVGNVDATVAASGVALRLDMAPILAKNAEKEGELMTVLDEMGNDLLQMWAAVDGAVIADDISVSNGFDDPLPIDRNGIVTEVTTLVKQGLMSKEYAVQVLKEKLGYNFPTNMLDQITADADAEAARVNAELAAGVNPDGSTDPTDNSGSDQFGGAQ